MKKLLAIIATFSLLLALAITPALAGKPIDGDGDGYKSNVDCNDSDPLINPGAAELCADGKDNNCDGFTDAADPTCGSGSVDNDADGYDSSSDCNDNNPTINPGVMEVCDNGIDDNCDGLTDAADPTCGSGTTMCSDYIDMNPCNADVNCEWIGNKSTGACQDISGGGTDPNHGPLTWNDYPASCVGCHGTQYNEMANATHYQWVGDTTEMTNQNGSLQGKLTNAVNSYCINILGDWKICGKCHAGRGLQPDDQAAGLENIDCLACHNEEYALARTRLPDGSMGPAIGLDTYVQNITKPTRKNCLKCHAYAGGGNAVKRGDISMSDATLAVGSDNNTDPNFDVHMNSAASDIQCQGCHVFQNHKTIGRGSDLRPTDDLARGSEVKCYTCHTGFEANGGHAAAGANRVDADRHVAHVACQSCHIDEYAKVATEMYRDWQRNHDGLPADGSHGPGHPYAEKAANQKPVFKFWNRTSDNYLMGDAVVLDPATGAYPTSRPLGDINDGKLYPFKYKTADQPMITADQKLLMLDTLVYIGQTGDVDEAARSGLVNMGYTADEPYEWVTTDTYQLINHGVAPATTVDCSKCHGTWGIDVDSELDLLGYKLKGSKAQICSQCHAEKNLKRDHYQMHNHVDKGAGMDCLFCHEFSRQSEFGGISPCDANAGDFVDNVPYPHTECSQ